MRWIKSAFITVYAVLAGGTASEALQRAFGDSSIGWLGAALSIGVVPAFAIVSMIFKPAARTSTGLPWLGAVVAVGTVLAVAGQVDAGLAPVAIAIVGIAGFVAYTRWYSFFGRTRQGSIDVGAPLPEFTLADPEGAEVTSRSFVGSPAVFVFYRGNWCPLCVAQIRELAGAYRDLADRGVRVALVSPQPPGATRKLAARFDAPMEFFVDPDNRAARALGIVDEGGLPLGMQVLGYDSDTVLPTVLVTDADGRIVLSDQTDNYRVRPEPATFLAALDGV